MGVNLTWRWGIVCAGFQVADYEDGLVSFVAVWIGMCLIYDMI